MDWGFFTLAFCEIQAEVLPRNIAKKYPAKVPAAKLARLTVSKRHQRKGFGKNMMVNALERAMIISRNIGIMGFLWMQRMKKQESITSNLDSFQCRDNKQQLFLAMNGLQQAFQTIS